jgi:hypothetical protein
MGHLEVTVGVDADTYSHGPSDELLKWKREMMRLMSSPIIEQDSESAPVQPVRVCFEPYKEKL